MCGIAGLLGSPGSQTEREVLAGRMVATLAHRGPDDFGAWADDRGRVGLGFQRLAILDLSPEGHQPMASVGGRYRLVFNGEVYNFAALREELAACGWSFRGHSDTEILLAAVEEWGLESTLGRLWGMYAFAIWDGREGLLTLVRDRLGKKPLYYGWQGRTFLFGSELKALQGHPAFGAAVDRSALASYLRFSYVPAPASIFEGIRKLPAGHWLTIDPAKPGELPPPKAYWDPVAVALAGKAHQLDLSDEEADCEVEQLLADAVRLRAVADVPLGAFLSGGIDSSLVVALLQRQSRQRVATFTIGYEEAEYDESRHARAVARHLGTDHTEVTVSAAEARAVIPRLPDLYDEPFADSSQIPTFLVSQLARRRVTVALSGDGGDEVFGGYTRYVAAMAYRDRVANIPRPVRRGLSMGAAAIPPRVWDGVGRAMDRVLPKPRRGMITGNRVHKVAGALTVGDADALYTRLVSTWTEPNALVRGGREPRLPFDGLARELGQPDRMMLFDLMGYLPDDILAKVDRASMGTSLEVRAPFLDHRLVELSWRLPLEHKIRDGVGKVVVRRILERYVPKSIFERQKHGFGVPIDGWLRGPLREWAGDLLSDERLTREGYLEPAPIQAALREHLAGTRNRQHELWAVLMFQAWLSRNGARRPAA